MMSDPATELLSAKDLVAESKGDGASKGVSLRSVRKWIKEKRLPHCNIGTAVYVKRTDWIAFLNQQRVKPQRSEWFTPELEASLDQKLREMVRQEVRTYSATLFEGRQMSVERTAA